MIRGEGVYSYDGDVYISAAGRYVLSGSLDDGSIVVDAYDSSKVYLLFDGVDITCADDAGLKVEQADKVFITLAEGSENSIKSGAEYSDEALKDEVDGAVFAHDDLTINGSGSLEVFGTPAMIALMEKTALESIVPYLDAGETCSSITEYWNLSPVLKNIRRQSGHEGCPYARRCLPCLVTVKEADDCPVFDYKI